VLLAVGLFSVAYFFNVTSLLVLLTRHSWHGERGGFDRQWLWYILEEKRIAYRCSADKLESDRLEDFGIDRRILLR
jgi:hypothetical protein